MWTGYCQNIRHFSAPSPTIFKCPFGDLKKKKNMMLYAALHEGFEVQLNLAVQALALYRHLSIFLANMYFT